MTIHQTDHNPRPAAGADSSPKPGIAGAHVGNQPQRTPMLFPLIMLLAASSALSTDMYLPALHTLQMEWQVSLSQVNLTLVLFFVFMSTSMLVVGPLSDRFGRRPVLVAGMGLYLAACFGCAAAPGISWLIGARILQSIGAATGMSLSLALSKDFYEGTERQRVLAYIGVLVPLSPMLAPLLGSLVLRFTSWRVIFLLQGCISLFTLYGAYRLKEPLTHFTKGGFLSMAGRYVVLMRNIPFAVLCTSLSFIGISFYAYLAASSHIYIAGFGLSEETYGLLFGLNAVGMTLGAFSTSRLCRRMTPMRMLCISLTGMALAGVLLGTGAGVTLWLMVAPMFGVSFFYGMSRPMSHHMILELVERDVGAASSMINFLMFIFGAVCMSIVSMEGINQAAWLGWFGVMGGGIPLVAMFLMRRTLADGR